MSDEPGIAKIARWYDDAIEHGTDDLPAAIDYVGRLLAALAYEDSVLLTAKDAELAEARRALEAVEKLANEEYAGDDYSCAVYAASLLDKIRALARAALAAEPDGPR